MALSSVFSAPVVDVEYQKDGGNDLVNTVKSTCDDKNILIEVTSEAGLGSATIKLIEGDWGDSVVIRFYLGGLESLAIWNSKLRLDNDQPEDLPVKAFDEHGKQHDGNYRLGLSGIYDGKGYYEVAVPKSLLDKDSKSITIQWIDFLRR